MAKIQGPYPGGPRRRDEDEAPPPVVLESVEELEAHRQEGARRHRERRRRRRIAAAFVATTLVAGGVGLWLGIRSHRSAEDVARELQEKQDVEQLLEKERRRILQELWRMEELERAPRPPSTR